MYKIISKHFLLVSRRVLISIIILLGVLFALARLLLPYLTDYRVEIQQLAADIMGSPVSIERIESGWSGLHPVIALKGVRVSNPEREREVVLESLEVMLGVLPSLIVGELTPKAVMIHVRQLELYREADGGLAFNLGAIEQDQETELGQEQLDWVVQQPDLQIRVDEFVLDDRTGVLPAMSLSKVSLDFDNQTETLVARIRAGASSVAEESSLTIRLDKEQILQGTYDAELFLYLRSASLPVWKETFSNYFLFPDTGTTDLSMWMAIADGEIRQVSGELSLNEVFYSPGQDDEQFLIDSMGGRYNWEPTDQGWALQVGNLHIDRKQQRWPDSALVIAYRRRENDLFLVNADYLRVQDFLPLIDRQPFVHSLIGNQLQVVSPEGEIRDLRLQFSTDHQHNELVDYALQASIVDLSVNAHDDWPGARGLDGYVAATSQAGVLQLNTDNGLLDLRSLFRDPLVVDSLRGDVSWTILDAGILIESSRLDANNSHISTHSRLSIHIPDEGSVFLDLQTNFRDGDGAYTSFYLPAKTMDEEAVEWLDKGIVAGHVDYGSFIFHGDVDRFPFDQNEGRFEVSFKVRDAVLDYYKDWPVIDEIEAEIEFVGRAMNIYASTGKIFDAEIRDTNVQIPDLTAQNPMLLIKGSAETPSQDMFRYLKETRLSGDYQQALDELRLEGKNDIDLSFRVPLTKGDPELKGSLTFLDNRLNIDSWDLQFSKITGLLNFSGNTFDADNIHASFNDRYVDVKVKTTDSDDNQTHVYVKASGLANLSSIIESRNPGLANQLSGEAPFEVLIDIPEKTESNLKISSSLIGTELKFPYPFNKSVADNLEFVLKTGFAGKAGEKIVFGLGDRLQAELSIHPESRLVKSAYVTLGDEPVEKSPEPGELVIGGRIDYLDIDAWKDWFNANVEAFTRAEDNSTFSSFHTDLKFDQLKYSRWLVEDLIVNAASSGKSWSANIDGEGARGMIAFEPADENYLLNIDLRHLSLLKAAEAAPEQQKGQLERSKLVPADLPDANIAIEKLFYDERELGQLSLATSSSETRYRIDEFMLKSEESSLSVTGDWKYGVNAPKNKHLTQLLVDIDSSDFGRLLERLGFEDTVKGGEGSLEANFLTEVTPLDITVSELSGDVSLSILKGEVVEVKPGGTGRIFGLLSLQALPRRLALDFSDIFSKGMSFDEIDGNFTISKGQAYTNNLTLDAPSSVIEVSGRIGLEEEDYDQLVRVIPNLSSTLPIAGALAGGPGLAVVMFITHKLLKDPIDKLTEFEYQVTGPWKSPEITRVDSDKNRDISEERKQTSSNTGDEPL